MPIVKPVLKYPGSKARLAWRIIALFPPHRQYVQPCAGGFYPLLAKEPVPIEVANDADHEIVNLFRVIRDQGPDLARAVANTPWAREEMMLANTEPTGAPLEDARRMLVRYWQVHGNAPRVSDCWKRVRDPSKPVTEEWARLPHRIMAARDRLAHVQIDCRRAVEVMAWVRGERDAVTYLDPPYMPDTTTHAYYRFMMSVEEHEELLAEADRAIGYVFISGYTHPLYETLLAHWTRVTFIAQSEKAGTREEVLWLNPVAARAGIQLPMAM